MALTSLKCARSSSQSVTCKIRTLVRLARSLGVFENEAEDLGQGMLMAARDVVPRSDRTEE
jgi:hypothetical protein